MNPPMLLGAETKVVCVDLDGTLIATDLLWESFLEMVRRNPFLALLAPVWALRGRAHLKRMIAQRSGLEPSTLPLRREVVAHIGRRRREGCRIILATASDERLANQVAVEVGLFDAVLASDGASNLKGAAKLERIRRELNGAAFEYVGDSTADLPLWKAAAGAVVVAAPPGTVRRLRAAGLEPEVLVQRPGWRPLLRAMRPHQWAKNLLVFAPVLLGHEYADLARMGRALACFAAFCLCASGVYVLNDLADLPSDRRHTTKRRRPIAAGELGIPLALLLGHALLAAGLSLGALLLPSTTALMLGLYVALTSAYSLWLKRKLLVDVLTLASLYTLRILAGGIAAGIGVSAWLLVFSMFLFLSLAFVKRYTELVVLPLGASTSPRGRGYYADDLDLVRVVGPTSGYLAAMVFVLYVHLSPDVARHYPDASLLYLVAPVILYWLTRIWFLAQRKQLMDDPVLFAVRDRLSLAAGALILALFVMASHLRLPGLAR